MDEFIKVPKRIGYVAVFDKKEAFLKQIGIFLSKREYKRAYKLSREFCTRYNEAAAHLASAKCLFWLGEYEEMLPEARKALRMSDASGKGPAAVMLATAYYKLGRLTEARKVLAHLEGTKNMDALKMRFIIAARQGKKKEQENLLMELSDIDQKEAEKFAMSILLQKDFERIGTISAVPKRLTSVKRK